MLLSQAAAYDVDDGGVMRQTSISLKIVSGGDPDGFGLL
jgi:hypothetical protein